jgi:ferric-dicitrate binding protein FerR (iron transport regulator)
MNGTAASSPAELLLEAEEWIRRIATGDPASCQAFAAWVKSSPEHVRAYLAIVCLDLELQDLDSNRRFDIQRLLAG